MTKKELSDAAAAVSDTDKDAVNASWLTLDVVGVTDTIYTRDGEAEDAGASESGSRRGKSNCRSGGDRLIAM